MRYRLKITSRTARELRKLPVNIRARIEATIEAAVSRLADDPRPPGCVKLHGAAGWRIRVGDYRVLYDIEDDVLTVTVLRAGHRRDVYRGL
jgi:mRNA interferase RelE/StbE